MPAGRRNSRAGQGGFTLIATMLVVALAALGLSQAGPMWSEQVKREREQDLLRVGQIYAEALASYRDAAPGNQKLYPDSLSALLRDTRFIGTIRHLRMLYPDPVNPGKPWGLIRGDDGRIRGVHSLSTEAPVAARVTPRDGGVVQSGRQYADWKFLAGQTQ